MRARAKAPLIPVLRLCESLAAWPLPRHVAFRLSASDCLAAHLDAAASSADPPNVGRGEAPAARVDALQRTSRNTAGLPENFSSEARQWHHSHDSQCSPFFRFNPAGISSCGERLPGIDASGWQLESGIALSPVPRRAISGSRQLASASVGEALATKSDNGVALEAKLSHTPTSRLEVSLQQSSPTEYALQCLPLVALLGKVGLVQQAQQWVAVAVQAKLIEGLDVCRFRFLLSDHC